MSRIFKARDEALVRVVVVKVLAPELAEGLSAERFAGEIRLAAGPQNPHIAPVLAAGVTSDRLPTSRCRTCAASRCACASRGAACR